MTRATKESVLANLHELGRKELVRRVRTSSIADDTEYLFWHVLVRDVAYEQIPRSERARMHVAAAEWIERVSGARVIDHAEFLAHHYGEALRLSRAAGLDDVATELVEPARRFMELAGDRVIALDLRKGELFYARAVELLPGGDSRRAPILVKRMQTFGWITDLSWETAEEIFHEATTLYRKSGDTSGLALAYAAYTPGVYYSGDPERASTLAKEALHLLEGQGEGPDFVRAYIECAQFLDGTEAVAIADRAVEMASDDALLADALKTRALTRIASGDVGGRDDLLASLEVAERAGLSALTVAALNDLGSTDSAIVGPAASLEWIEQAIELSGRRGIEGAHNWNKGTSMIGRFELGRWDDVLRVAGEVFEWERRNQRYLTGIQCLAYTVRVLLARGRAAEAVVYQDELLERAGAAGEPGGLSAAATLAYAVGDADEATRLLRSLAESEYGGSRRSPVAELVRLAVALRHTDLAVRLREKERGTFRRTDNALLTADALLAEANGAHEQAHALYADAVARWREWGFVLEEAHALVGLARCRFALGPPGDAEQPLREAREIFERLGAQTFLLEIDALEPVRT
jgi:tetratricopeptide (TPR) repeat protein